MLQPGEGAALTNIGKTVGGGEAAVLEDPTGRRARWLRRAGRGVFLVFLCWLLAIVLGGLGLWPVAGIPLTHALRPSHGPPVLVKLPRPRQPSAADLRPAAPATLPPAAAGRAGQHGRSSTAPGQTKTSPSAGASHGRSGTAPGRTKTTPSAGASHGSATAPGRTTSTPTGRSKKP